MIKKRISNEPKQLIDNQFEREQSMDIYIRLKGMLRTPSSFICADIEIKLAALAAHDCQYMDLLLKHSISLPVSTPQRKAIISLLLQHGGKHNFVIQPDQYQDQEEAMHQAQQEGGKLQTQQAFRQGQHTLNINYQLEAQALDWQAQQSNQDEEQECQPDYEALSAEMMEVAQQCHSDYVVCYQKMGQFFQRLASIAYYFHFSLHFIGSFATGLWMPFSDIDCALVFNDFQEGNSCLLLDETMEVIFVEIQKLKVHQRMTIVRSNQKLPIIKIKVCEAMGGKLVEIFLFYNKKINVLKYTHLVLETVHSYPQLRPIFYILRTILHKFHLHDPKRNGLKSYALFLMIRHHLDNYTYQNLGRFVDSFMYYYGFVNQYEYYLGEDVEAVLKINLMDPINMCNNMGGKNTDAQRLQQMCRCIYYGINFQLQGSKLQYLLSLSQLI